MILCIGTTPAAQRVMVFRQLAVDAVNRASTTLDGMAGKSINVAKVLKALGEEPIAAGFAGGERGAGLRAFLAARNIRQSLVDVAAPTRQCTTVIDESTNTHTELVEESRPVEEANYRKLGSLIQPLIKQSRAVIMSGSIPPGGPVSLYAECTRLAQAAGALSVVDAQGAPLIASLADRPGLVKPNRTELAATVGRPLLSEAALKLAMRELCERGAQRVVVTAGSDPALAFDGANYWRILPPAIQSRNPVGSGDAFTAALVWRLLRGDDLGEAARWAAAAGAANALTLMPGELELAEVERLLRQVEVRREVQRVPTPARRKAAQKSEAARNIKTWKRGTRSQKPL
jgi:tagatose 6-phosphate kinase